MHDQKKTIVYVTASRFKREENKVFVANCRMLDGAPVSELFEFEHQGLTIPETLEVDLTVMVEEEVKRAYGLLRRPCLVEHAGLIFDEFKANSYPGGLTKPMWDTLRDQFLEETHSKGRSVIARAVVGYCDGKRVYTFVGETVGRLANEPRGKREFYWDTVFIPDQASGSAAGKTYAEIVDDPGLGLTCKVVEFSQSSRAMLKFLEFLRTNPSSGLW